MLGHTKYIFNGGFALRLNSLALEIIKEPVHANTQHYLVFMEDDGQAIIKGSLSLDYTAVLLIC